MRALVLSLLIGALIGFALAKAPLLTASNAIAQAVAPVTVEGGGQDACARPAYLVVWIDNLNRAKSAAYGKALQQTQIVRRHGGKYIVSGSPTELLEGDWPAERGFVIEKYPCMQAIRDFWYSDEYQKSIMPLRRGSGDYIVAAFEEYQPRQN
ncbi:MAG: DUF1330 domain-containing protein [Rhodospirillaceae bacterium]|nr:DUF1330 domain-containing protein [Rhodospirillaceae bacterium]